MYIKNIAFHKQRNLTLTYCESVVDGKTGVLIDDISADKIIDAIQIIERNIDVYKEHCFSQAKKFDLDVFVERNKKIINEEI